MDAMQGMCEGGLFVGSVEHVRRLCRGNTNHNNNIRNQFSLRLGLGTAPPLGCTLHTS